MIYRPRSSRCDRCGRRRRTRPYTISTLDGSALCVLCQQCSTPLGELVDLARRPPGDPRVAMRPPAHSVIPVD